MDSVNSVLVISVTVILYLVAYHTYGKFLAKKIFKLAENAVCPSEEFRDDNDFVPTKKEILFGHHFTSIAGTGPIVGPAIAIIWGWVPALIWIIFGSIFMGAVHDFGALIVSMRHKGRSIGDLSSNIVNTRVRSLFMIIIFFALLLLTAIFGVVIAAVFNIFPQSVLAVWLQIPIAIWLGHMIYKKGKPAFLLSIVAVILMYITIMLGPVFPIKMPVLFGMEPVAIWVILLLIYAYIASILPVQTLLQPRDYINGHQLFVALGLMFIGVFIAHPTFVAPAVNLAVEGAPPIMPMLFVVIACGAISGFHALVSSGTSSKQCDNERSSLNIGYAGMLTEGVLAVFVLIACGAGIGMGLQDGGQTFTGVSAFTHQYADWSSAAGLASKIHAFVSGSANLVSSLGIPSQITLAIMGVFVASFAATSLDTATRLQRYTVSEIARSWNFEFFTRKHAATCVAVGAAFILAFSNGSGKGALALWPLFGSVNQLLAGLALLVITIYLARKKKPIVFTVLPMVFMLTMTGWAMVLNIINYFNSQNWLLFGFGSLVFMLELWMIAESALVLNEVYIKGRSEEIVEIISQEEAAE